MTTTQAELWVVIDEINKNWHLLDKQYRGAACVVEGCPLVMNRINGQMRFIYKDKPLSDCTVEDKIEACKHLPKFVEGWKKQQEIKLKDAVAGNEILKSFLQVSSNGNNNAGGAATTTAEHTSSDRV